MTITVEGTDIRDIQRQVFDRPPMSPLFTVTARPAGLDYDRELSHGCIVKFSNENVPREFMTASDAADAIREYLIARELLIEGDRLARERPK